MSDERTSEQRVEYVADCKRIRSVVQLHTPNRIKLSLEQCEQAWKAYSDTYCAGWLYLPDDDAELFRCIRHYIPVCEHCGAPK